MPDTQQAILEQRQLVDLLRRSLAQSTEIIAKVTPDQMTLPTPCPRFDVRTLLGHMLFAARRSAIAGRREPVPDDGPAVTGVADTGWRAEFEAAASEVLAAWEAPASLEGDIALPFGTFPAAVVASIYIQEQVTHAWDLAVATGTAAALDPRLAEAVLPLAASLVNPEIRGGDDMPFGPQVQVPAGAPAYERLAGFLGRRVP